MPDTGSRLTLRGVSKDYNGVVAVDDVNLDVEPGEFITLLGPSGSGKTTTLNLIAGFLTATSGDIAIDDVSVTKLAPYKRDIGMVFQNYSLFPHMSVADNVGFPLVERKVPKAERRAPVEAALEMVRLGGYGDRRPHELSGGQQQRVAVARALIYRPRLVLFDEPLGALDKKLRESLQAELRRIHRELGVTMVFVTHDQEEALSLSDRIAVFEGGRIVQVGTTTELYRRPATPFVASFIGDSNLLSGRVRSVDGVATLETAIGAIALPPMGAEGSEATVLIRPEHVKLRARGRPQSTEARVEVEDVAFLGPFSQVMCRAEDGTRLRMRCPAGEGEHLAPGDRIEVGWRREDVLLLDATAEAATHGRAH